MNAPPMSVEDEAIHALRVRAWVTFVIAVAFLGAELMPEASGWLGFMSSLFWVWRN